MKEDTALKRRGMSFEGLDNHLVEIHTLYVEFFYKKLYDWFYEVQPGDVVVDIGSCIGMFTCHALDKGAKEVYAIEPNRDLLRTTLYNSFMHICDKAKSPVIPINAFMGTSKENGYGEFDSEDIPLLDFQDFIKSYNIEQIDFLKIDCEGGEYDILTKENLPWIKKNVKHIAVEVHMLDEKGPENLKRLRDTFISEFEPWQIRFSADGGADRLTDDFIDNYKVGDWGGCFMIYICNYSAPHLKTWSFDSHLLTFGSARDRISQFNQ